MEFITLPLPLFRKRPAEVEELRARQLARVRRLLPADPNFFNLERLSLERLVAVGNRLEHDAQAEQKGLTLLRSWLSPEQRRQFDEKSYFEVIGSDTGTKYCIHRGHVVNVVALDAAGRETRRLCFGPEGRLATGDVMLAQKIALETMERAALVTANVHAPTRQVVVVIVMMVIATIGFFCPLWALVGPLRYSPRSKVRPAMRSIGFVLLLLLTVTALAEPVAPSDIGVIDGATIELKGTPISLVGFEAPELGSQHIVGSNACLPRAPRRDCTRSSATATTLNWVL
jgi:hypothetical protein